MKKLRFVEALFALAAVALAAVGCSNLDSSADEESATTVQAQTGKVALSVSAGDGYARTVLPTALNLADYKYTLKATAIGSDGTTAEEAEMLLSATSYGTLTAANHVYIDAGTYAFELAAANDDGTVLSGSLTKTVSATDAALSFRLFATESDTAVGSLAVTVTYAADYGVTRVTPTLYAKDGTSLAASYPLTYTASEANSGATVSGVITGDVPAGTSYVGIVLSDGSAELAKLSSEYVYAINGVTSTSDVTVPIKQYKATVVLTTTATEAPAVTLKNTAVSAAAYTLTTTSTGSPFTYTGYVPVGSYGVYIGNKTSASATVSNATSVPIDDSRTLTGISASLSEKERFIGTTADSLLADITVTARYNNNTTATVTSGFSFANTGTFDPTATASQTLTVEYLGQTATVTVQLIEDYITSWTPSCSATYSEGDALKDSDFSVILTYASGATDTKQESEGSENWYTVAAQDGASTLPEGECTLVVTLADSLVLGTGVEKSKELTITVAALPEYDAIFYDSDNTTVLKSIKVKKGHAIPIAEAYTKNGQVTTWYSDTNHTNAWNFASTLSKERYLYAGEWTDPYTVSFSAGSASAATGAVESVSQLVTGGSVTLPENGFEAGAYVFKGWATVTSAGENDTIYAAGAQYTPASNITLYAQWTEKYTLTLTANGGTGSDVVSTTGITYTLPDATGFTAPTSLSNAAFSQWNTEADGTGIGYLAGTEITISTDTILHAQWYEEKTLAEAAAAIAAVTDADAGTKLYLKVSDAAIASSDLKAEGGLTAALKSTKAKVFLDFSGCTLTTVSSGKEFEGTTGVTDAGLVGIVLNSPAAILPYTFKNSLALTSVVLGSGVTNIKGKAFENCTGLKYVTVHTGYSWVTKDKASVTITAPAVNGSNLAAEGSWYSDGIWKP